MSTNGIRVSLFVGCLVVAIGAALAEPSSPNRTDAYGDPLPKGVRFRLGSVRLRHDDDVMALVWLPDGRTLASASWDRTVRLWQIPGGKQIAEWKNVEGVVFSPDGRSLACGEGDFVEPDRPIQVIDVATGKKRRQIQVAKDGGTLFNSTPNCQIGIISPDGKILAVGTGGVHLYAMDSGKELGSLKTKVLEFGRPLVFSPDSRTLLVSSDEGLYRWTIGTGAKDKILAAKGEPNFFSSFAFSPDGKTLAAMSSNNGISLRSWPAGKELRRLKIEDGYTHDFEVLRFSPDGKLLASAEGGIICFWDPSTGKLLRQFEGHNGNYIWDLAFSPDGSLLASAGADHAIIVWEVQPRKAPRPLTGVGHWLVFVGLAADGRALLTRSADDVLTAWNVGDGRRLRTLEKREEAIDRFLFDADAARKRALLRREVESGRYGKEFTTGFRHTAFSSDHTTMAVGNHEGILLLRKASNGLERRLLDDESRVQNAKNQRCNISVEALAFSPDNRTLAACYSDGRLFLWNPHTGQPHHILSFPKPLESFRSLEFSADGRLLAFTDRRNLYLVETASGQRLRERNLGEEWCDCLAFAPDNRTLAFEGYGIHLRDLPTDKEYPPLQGHRGGVCTLRFSPDGAFLLSGGDDNTILSWDLAGVLRRRPSSKVLAITKLPELWADLASKDAVRAQRAVATLIQAPDAALPFLKEKLPPVPPARMEPILALIADLDSDQFSRRGRASQKLEKIGEDGVPALCKALKDKPTLESRKRIEFLLDVLDRREVSTERLRLLRAMQVVETIDTEKSRRILEEWSRGASEAPLTQEAKAAFRRIVHQEQVPRYQEETISPRDTGKNDK